MDKLCFKERVRRIVTECSKKYKSNFVDCDYLVCSSAFSNGYYIISAHKDNYQHLTGVHSLISPKEFFDRCYNGTLLCDDFDFIKKGQPENSVKGSVREKISILENTMDLFLCEEIFVEESFKKNKVICSFATASTSFTLGFVNNKYSTPKSLMKKNQLSANCGKADLILRKKRTDPLFNELVLGDADSVKKYYNIIHDLLSLELKSRLANM